MNLGKGESLRGSGSSSRSTHRTADADTLRQVGADPEEVRREEKESF